MTSPDLTTKAAEIRAGLEGVTPGICWDVVTIALGSSRHDANLVRLLDPATVLAFLDERAEHLATIARLEGRLEFALGEGTSWAIKAGLSERRAIAAESTIAKQAERLKEMEGAVAAEREACAKVAEGFSVSPPGRLERADCPADAGAFWAADEIATLIRARAALTEGGAEHERSI